MTDTKKAYKDETPYIAVDVMTNENLTRHAHMHQGYDAHPGRAVVVYYRPRKRRAKARSFP